MTKIIDISLDIHPGMPVWPGDPPIILERVCNIDAGESANVSRLDMSVHTGTHIDAPYHYILEGKCVERLPLESLIGEVQVVQMADDCDLITAMAIKKAGMAHKARRVLFKTRNSACWDRGEKTFQEDFVAISSDGAKFLVECGIELVGVDYLSVAPFDASFETHHILLSAEVVLVEGLNLSQVEAGWYKLVCLPLKLVGADGAPARAVLLAED